MSSDSHRQTGDSRNKAWASVRSLADRPAAQLKWGALAVLVAAVAQSLLRDAPGNIGWLLYGAGAALFVIGFGSLSAVPSASRVRQDSAARTPWLWNRHRVFLWASIVSMIGGLFAFGPTNNGAAGWIWYSLSLLLFVLGAHNGAPIRSGPRTAHADFRSRAVRLLPLLAILVIAVAVRGWQLEHFPFGLWYDEAVNGLISTQMLEDPGFRPVYLDLTAMPAHFNYLVAFTIAAFGKTSAALRLVAALFGAVGVLFAYLLFSRWFGHGPALVAAFMLAVLRYDLTFSRLAMPGISTPAFELATLYLLDRALAEKRPADFAWFGLTLGMGLAFHTAFRLFPVVLVVFLIARTIPGVLSLGLGVPARSKVATLWPPWLIAGLGVAVAVAPVAQFALQNSGVFFARTRTVSIFEKRDEPNLGKALWNNTVSHLTMYNQHGDRNGRHNLPGEPMLDPALGVLFVLGTAHSIWRWRDPANAVMLLLFLTMLSAGIFSLDFEAPQSYRAIGTIPAVVYFAAVPLALASQAIHQALRPKRPPLGWFLPKGAWKLRSGLWAGAVMILLVSVGILNLRTFFIKQRLDPAVWASHSAGETLVAGILQRNADDHDLVLSALFYDPPTVRFLAGDVQNTRKWTTTDRLPLVRADNTRGAILLLDRTLQSAYDEAQRVYPMARTIQHRAPGGHDVVLYEVILSPEVLRSVQGVAASYFAGEPTSDSVARTESVADLKVDWTAAAPLAEPFFAELRSTLVVKEYGEYRFATRGDLTASLWIDEFPVGSEPIELALGTHALRWQVTGGDGISELFWQPPSQTEPQPVPAQNLFVSPVTNSGLLGAYYPTPDWSGPPAFTQVDPQLAYYFHIIPLPRPYSVRWTGKLFAPGTGDYGFEIFSVDGSKLLLDGQTIVDNPEGRKSVTGAASLSQGWHDVQVDFSDRTSGTQIYLYWTPPGGERELVPAEYLSPPMGAYPSSP